LPEVKQERTSWRDEGLSKRHRLWGWDCPAIDIDFLLIEYNQGKAYALVEYKNEHAPTQHTVFDGRRNKSYEALIGLGNAANVAVIGCRYADDYSWYKPVPLNEKAQEFLPKGGIKMSEQDWIRTLHRISGIEKKEE